MEFNHRLNGVNIGALRRAQSKRSRYLAHVQALAGSSVRMAEPASQKPSSSCNSNQSEGETPATMTEPGTERTTESTEGIQLNQTTLNAIININGVAAQLKRAGESSDGAGPPGEGGKLFSSLAIGYVLQSLPALLQPWRL